VKLPLAVAPQEDTSDAACRSSAEFRTTPGLVFFYSYMGAECSDVACLLAAVVSDHPLPVGKTSRSTDSIRITAALTC
jgi:hypothetical protein